MAVCASLSGLAPTKRKGEGGSAAKNYRRDLRQRRTSPLGSVGRENPQFLLQNAPILVILQDLDKSKMGKQREIK